MKPLAKNQRGGFALGLIAGLLLGLAVALAVALYVTKTPVPLMNKAQQRTPEQDAAEAEKNKNWDPNAALAGKPVARPMVAPPSAPASDTAIVPRTNGPVLPTPADNGRVSGASAPAARTESPRSARDPAAILNGNADATAADTAKPAGDPFVYYVQVGAYSKAEDAEQQRAKLALSGLQAAVSERDQNGRTVHRVRLGPFEKKDEADAQVDRARAIDPDASLVRVARTPKP